MEPGDIPPTLPFHLARAYAAGSGVSPRSFSRPEARGSGTRAGPANSIDSVELSSMRPGINRLVAAKVPGLADFAPPAASSPDGSSFPMYRHPADKNAAATGVSVGKFIDLNG